MATRKIVKIDEEKCNGCALCIPIGLSSSPTPIRKFNEAEMG